MVFDRRRQINPVARSARPRGAPGNLRLREHAFGSASAISLSNREAAGGEDGLFV